MTTAQERGGALHDAALVMLHAAVRLDRRPVHWHVSHQAEIDLRCAQDDDGLHIYAVAGAGKPGLLGLPVDIHHSEASIELELENGDRMCVGEDLRLASIRIEKKTGNRLVRAESAAPLE